MDRNAKKKSEFIEKYKKIFQIFEDLDDFDKFPIIENVDLELTGKFTTAFTYPLDDYGKETLKRGLQNFILCSPYVLAFNPKINMIRMTDRSQ